MKPWFPAIAVLACLTFSLLASPAAAHPIGLATWTAKQSATEPAVWSVVWRTSAKERKRSTPPTVTGPCSVSDAMKRTLDGPSRILSWQLHCADGGLEGLQQPPQSDLEVMVYAQWANGHAVRGRLSTSVRDMPLGAPGEAKAADAVSAEGSKSQALSGSAGKTSSSGFWLFVTLGFEHVLEGYDHLLFVLVLLMLAWPVGARPQIRALVAAITGFTIAHSLTLGLSVAGWVVLPAGPIEAAIAWSVVVAAASLIRNRAPTPVRSLMLTAGSFGLLHGFGFAGALREVLGGQSSHLAEALVGFNIGVELGQLLFATVAVIVGLLVGRARSVTRLSLRVDVAIGYGVGLIAAFWMFERVADTLG